MYKVKALKNYGNWCKDGEIYIIANEKAVSLDRDKTVKIIKFMGNYPYAPYHIKRNIKSTKQQIKILQMKLKSYERLLVEE